MGRRLLSLLVIPLFLLALAAPVQAAPEPPPGVVVGQQDGRVAGAAPKTPVVRETRSGGHLVKPTTKAPQRTEDGTGAMARATATPGTAAAFNESYGDDQYLTAPTQWWTVNGWTIEQIYDYAQNQGARVSDIAHQPGTQLTFTATLVKNANAYWVRSWGLYYGLTDQGVVDLANSTGTRPASVARYWTADGWRFAVALVDNTGDGARPWWWYYGDASFVTAQQQATGARPVKLRPFDAGGGARWYDLLMTGWSSQQFWWWLGGSDVQINNLANQNGARLVDAGRNADGTFNAIMLRNASGPAPGWWYGLGHDELNLKTLRKGARLISAQGYVENGRTLFVGVMTRETTGADQARAMVQNTALHTAWFNGGSAIAELSDGTLGKFQAYYGDVSGMDARVRVASVSKTFAAAELLRLAAAGKVSLDARVSQYLPNVTGGDQITLRNLLQHTSGLYNFTDDLPGFATTMTQGFTNQQLLDIVNRHARLFTPGSRYSYSNSNYLVIGMIIERVTGRSYPDQMSRDLIGPFGLTGTSVPTDTALSSVRLRGYWWNPDTSTRVETTGQNASRWAAGGQMVSTVPELNLFYKNLLTGYVTGASWLNEMKSNLVYTGEGSKWAGMGIFRTTLSCGKNVWWHDGRIPGYRTGRPGRCAVRSTCRGARAVTASSSAPPRSRCSASWPRTGRSPRRRPPVGTRAAAALAAHDAGQIEHAAALADSAAAHVRDPSQMARLALIRAGLEHAKGRPEVARWLLVDAARDVVTLDSTVGAMMVFEAMAAAWDTPNPATAAADTAARLPDPDTRDSALRRGAAGLFGLATGDLRGGVAALREFAGHVAATRRDRSLFDHSRLQGWEMLLGDYDSVHEQAVALDQECREQGALGVLPRVLLRLARCRLFLGRHRDAYATAMEGLEIARDTGQHHYVAMLSAVLAVLAALTGDEHGCRRPVGEDLSHGIPPNPTWHAYALGLLDLGLGRHESALHRLAGVTTGADRHTVIALHSLPEQVEAAARLGRAAEARQACDRFQQWAESIRTPWARAVELRCRALLAPGEEAGPLFEAALAAHDGAAHDGAAHDGAAHDGAAHDGAAHDGAAHDGIAHDGTARNGAAHDGTARNGAAHNETARNGDGRPFERARTQLLHGEWLRRAKRRRAAREALGSALESFERMRATPWIDRARSELRAAGTSPVHAPGTVDLAARLTAQELQVIRLAATGMTNRDIGAQLFLSPRTVGYHLSNVYPKLGVAGRAALARLDLA
ncbi:serine hydrolase [Streptosporangium sp. NPDC000396]|uniref:serine hydrolase n=1 Tax=Streptosporangium sp. NPDC000396 TaxID=3366185 RepID=UPI00369B0171